MESFYKILTLVILPILMTSQETGDQLFSESFVHEIRISSDDVNLLNTLSDTFFFEFGGEFSYTEVDVEIDGHEVSSVGIRVKGGLTAFDPKKPLKIDFNEFVEDQNYNGVKKVNLHNVYFDQSSMREALSYDILRTAGLKAPRTAFTEVYINDELQGLYLLVEQIDKTFLQNNFADDSGVLYKDAGCFISVKGESGSLSEYQEFETTLQTQIGGELEDKLSGIIDIDVLLKQLMLQNLMNTVDNIYSFNCNYYIYHEPKSDLLYYIPWDFNLSLFEGVNNHLLDVENEFFSKLYARPKYAEKLLTFACQALDYNFTEERLFDRIDFYKSLIEEPIKRDPKIPFNYADFLSNINVLRSTIQNRIQTFSQDLTSMGYDCNAIKNTIPYQSIVINEIVCSSDSIGGINDGTGSYPDWIELYNNTSETIDFQDVYLSDDIDFLKHWKFPENTYIDGNSYLIVWADRDVDEIGLHADFKLSRFSGEVFLINEDNSLIDSVSYLSQETNIAYARVPNGIGNFKNQSATFSQNNNTTRINTIDEIEVNLYPNPINDYIYVVIEQVGYVAEVYSMLGKKMIEQELSKGKNYLDCSYLSVGSYYIKLSTRDTEQTYKVIKL